MKKLAMLGIIGGAAILTAAPVSLQWSQKNVALSLDSAQARDGRPLTHPRAHRRAAYGTSYVAPCGQYSSSYAIAEERLRTGYSVAPYSYYGPSSYYRRPY